MWFTVFANLAFIILLADKSATHHPPTKLLDFGIGWIFGKLSHYWITYLPILALIALYLRDLASRQGNPWPKGINWRLVACTGTGLLLAELW